MKRTSKRVAECGCAVHVHSEIGEEGYTVIGKVEIVGPCPEHRRPEPAAAEAVGENDPVKWADWFAERIASIADRINNLADIYRKRSDALEARIAALEPEVRLRGIGVDALGLRVEFLEEAAGYEREAGDGYREIPAGERGEGWGRIPGPDLEAVTDMVYICEDGHNTRYPASVGKKYEWVRCWSGCVKRAYYAGYQFTAASP